MSNCPCNSQKSYADCCQLIHNGTHKAITAQELMRARYVAHTKADIGFIVASTHISKRRDIDLNDLLIWCKNASWEKLEVLGTIKGEAEDKEGKVEFKAYYKQNNKAHCHHELSYFKKEQDNWYFVDGEQPMTAKIKKLKIGRNSPCTCGSGKKYKQCCGKK